MKMSGPYAWVPPRYWYAHKLGGAFGFNSETSAGPDIPRVSSLRRMLTPEDLVALWQDPEARQFHAAPFWSPFSRLTRFDHALAMHYGKPTSLEDYVSKAQLANYANVRAQFEAYNARMSAKDPSTGVIYWMLNNAWPSLHWHLINHDLDPAGAYFGAQKANEAVHIQYSYDDRSVVVVNHTLRARRDLHARIRLHALNGSVLYDQTVNRIDLPPNDATRLAVIPALRSIEGVYFVELELLGARGESISRNVYWLAAQPDQLDWPQSNFYVTPVSRYADFTALNRLPVAKVDVHEETRTHQGQSTTTVTLEAPKDSVGLAFFLHASITDAKGEPVAPVLWSGNDVSLWPGESATLTVRYPAGEDGAATLKLQGWNVRTRALALGPRDPKAGR